MEPREAEPSVLGLNEHALEALIAEFLRLEKQPPPRVVRLNSPLLAQLVISPEPGYGKSHLIGRFFQRLNGRALRVYLRPFQDASSAWRTILRGVLVELAQTEKGSLEKSLEGVSQLRALALHIFANLTAMMVESGQLVSSDAVCQGAALRADPVGSFGVGAKDQIIADWMRENFFSTTLLSLFEEQLTLSNLDLNAPPGAWLKILFAIAFQNSKLLNICCDWIKGNELEEGDKRALCLTRNESSEPEGTWAGRNEIARQRLFDLLKLSGFYRPMVLCFDQTELLTGRVEECAEFGRVIEDLVCNGRNVLIVVTANQQSWESIKLSMEVAHHDRFCQPICLEGIDLKQSQELIRLRCESYNIAPDGWLDFMSNGWLKSFFSEAPRAGVRALLRVCEQRWSERSKAKTSDKAIVNKLLPQRFSNSLSQPQIGDFFSRSRKDVSLRPGDLDFDADILRWFVSPLCLGDTILPWQVSGPESFGSSRQFAALWMHDKTLLLFGVEDSNNALHWRGRLRENKRKRESSAAKGFTFKVTYLRTPEQRPIPGASWSVIGQEIRAEEAWFQIRTLAFEEWLEIVAAFDVWVKSKEGDLPFSTEITLSYVREKLAPIWRGFIAWTGSISQPPQGLQTEIRRVLCERPFLSLTQLVASLPGRPEPTSVLDVCEKMSEIAVFRSPTQTVLQWKAET